MMECKTPETAGVPPTTHGTERGTTILSWQRRFLELLPSIQRHAKFRFRNLKPELREELIQEAIARALSGFSSAGRTE